MRSRDGVVGSAAPGAPALPAQISIHAFTTSHADDVATLVELGELRIDDALSGELLLGVVDHRVVAVLTGDGTLVTHPFHPAADTCELLRLRARQCGRPLSPDERTPGRNRPALWRKWREWYRRGRVG
ncbi:hypothetical protein [Amycolatopsis sp. PS_44_ISF1]|uniref:hypothetical protein n=1 Tax=Amycolatopsis sp. PS_44_ISF1 TaxID=2974917 RepID=UPI0028DFF973|nr:hypothetical protein [Amycolatopsis sp. PS_44_ISF1]MDT8912349.1 hypothetical protein [Amycolatopsis sp. PS_44_ISF1]